jgi:hypothetical protein
VTENGITAVFQAKSGEITLIFKTDDDEYKNRHARNMPVSDFVFFAKNLAAPTTQAIIVFAELGGNKGSRSIQQLRATVQTITTALKSQQLTQGSRRYAVVAYSAGSAPQNMDQVIREFSSKYGTVLKFKNVSNRIDIRQVLGV